MYRLGKERRVSRECKLLYQYTTHNTGARWFRESSGWHYHDNGVVPGGGSGVTELSFVGLKYAWLKRMVEENMARYEYQARDGSGTLATGVVAAASTETLLNKLL